MRAAGGRLLATLVGVLALLTAATPVPARGTFAQLTASVINPTNLASNLSLVSPTGLTATVVAGTSVTLSWTAATPNNGNGNGYAITGRNNGTSSTCPTTASSYTTWVGSTATATTTFTDTGSIARGSTGSFACYLVQTGYNPTAAPPWSSAPLWTSQGSLAIAVVALGITRVQTGPESAFGGTSVRLTFGAASTAGTLLVAFVSSGDTGGTASTPPSGSWKLAARAVNTNRGAMEIWYYPNNPGGITSGTWTDSSSGGWIFGNLAEFRGVATSSPLDATGAVVQMTSATSATVSTSAATTVNGELALTTFGANTNGLTLTQQSGWSNLVNDGTNGGFISSYKLGSAASTISDQVTSSVAVTWVGVVATFK